MGLLHLVAGLIGGFALRFFRGSFGERVWSMILVLLYGIYQIAGDWGHPQGFFAYLALLMCAVMGIGIGPGWRGRRFDGVTEEKVPVE